MSKKLRYFLISLGFVIFAIFAPVIILYVTGLKYDVAAKQFVQTGILALRSDPSSITETLDGKTVRDTAGDIKFLVPGEYSLQVEKTGYQTWSKRFFIQPNQVTWASPSPNKLVLFKNTQQPRELASNVLDMYVTTTDVLYLTPLRLTVVSMANPGQSEVYNLKRPATTITASPNQESFLLLNNERNETPADVTVFNVRDKTLSDISNLFNDKASFQFSDDNTLYALDNRVVYEVDIAGQKKTPIFAGVDSFTVVQGTLYYLQQGVATSSLNILPLTGGPSQTLISNIPDFSTSKLMVNYQKQMLVLLDSTLYRVSNTLVPVTSDVANLNFDEPSGSLLVLHDNELDAYNYGTEDLSFITRTGAAIKNFIYRPDIGYALFYKDSTLEALELDLRDHQNEYIFYQAQTPTKFAVDSNAKNLYILDGDKLMIQNIR